MLVQLDSWKIIGTGMFILNYNLASVDQAHGNSGKADPVVVNALPEGLNIREMFEDIKRMKATLRQQAKRIAQLEQAAQRRKIAQQQAFITPF